MSLLVAAAVSVVAVSVGGWLAVRRRRRAEPPGTDAQPAPAVERERPLSSRGFRVELGDVLEIAGQELWLERGWLLAEGDQPVMALLFSAAHTLVVEPGEPARLTLARELELELPATVPSALEVGGVRFERARRLPVTVTALGPTPAPPFDEAVITELRGLAGDVLYVLGHQGFCKAYQGRAVQSSDVTLWGGGESTLE